MLSLKINKRETSKVRTYLIKNELVVSEFKPIIEEEYIFFPIKKEQENLLEFLKEKKIKYDIIEKENFQKKSINNFKDEIISLLNENEIKFLKTAFDVIGSIAILEIEKELEKKEKEIARIIMKYHKNIKTVLKKSGIHEGVYRTQKMQYILGENTKETIHKENGIRLKLNVEEVYFSPRLSTERKRILEQIKENERILCLFSGAGPYPILFAKNKLNTKIVSIEINPIGIKYQKENIKLNRIKEEQIKVYEGDVREIIPRLNEKEFERIVMPLPKNADDFLDIALTKAKKGTIIHLYDFIHEDNINKKAEQIKEKIKNIGFNCRIKSIKAGQYAPREFRICHDIEILD